jgi:hypothetical protein
MDNNIPHERLLVQLASLQSYPYVQVLTDQFANPNALGALLEFVSRLFVRTILEKWSQDCCRRPKIDNHDCSQIFPDDRAGQHPNAMPNRGCRCLERSDFRIAA